MAVSILNIDVDTDAFKSFLALYEKYKESLGKLPGAWQAVNKATASTGVTLGELTAAMLTQNSLIYEGIAATAAADRAERAKIETIRRAAADAAAAKKKQADADKQAERDAADARKQQQESWERIDRITGSIYDKVTSAAKRTYEAGKELAKWGAIATGIVAGVTFGGLFGIDRLAGFMAGASRSARGLGVTPAEQQAFQVNYQQYTDPAAMLSQISNAQADLSKRGAFYAAGITEDQLRSEDPEQISRRVIQRTKDLYDQAGPNNRNAQFMQAHGLDQLLPGGLEDFRRIGTASQADLNAAAAKEAQDKKSFAVDPATSKAWTDFINQMNRAATVMGDVLGNSLVKLAGPLEHLSEVFTQAAEKLLKSDELVKWIGKLGDGIEWLASYLTSEAFKQNMEELGQAFLRFEKSMGELVDWTVHALVRLHIISDPDAPPAPVMDPNDPAPRGHGPADDPQIVDPAKRPVGAQETFGLKWWFYRTFKGIDPPADVGSTWDGPNGYGQPFPNDPFAKHSNMPSPLGTPPTSSGLEKNAEETWDFYKGLGYTDAAAAAEVGNEWGESGGDPTTRGDGGLAGGSLQWHQDRRDKILDETGIDVWHASHLDQLKAAWAERHGIDSQSTMAREDIRTSTTTRGAVTPLVTAVERSEHQEADIEYRTHLADEALRRFGGRHVVSPDPAPSGSDKSPAAAIEKLHPKPDKTSDNAPMGSGRALLAAIEKLSRRPAATPAAVTVRDLTGGSAVVSVSQLAFG